MVRPDVKNIVKYEYRCPFCREYLAMDETLSFKETLCPKCGKTITPQPLGLNSGPIVKLNLSLRQRRILAGLCGLFLGATGAHKFVLNYNLSGAIMLFLAIVLSALNPLWSIAIWFIGAMEGIIYLSTKDQIFKERYINKHRYWF